MRPNESVAEVLGVVMAGLFSFIDRAIISLFHWVFKGFLI